MKLARLALVTAIALPTSSFYFPSTKYYPNSCSHFKSATKGKSPRDADGVLQMAVDPTEVGTTAASLSNIPLLVAPVAAVFAGLGAAYQRSKFQEEVATTELQLDFISKRIKNAEQIINGSLGVAVVSLAFAVATTVGESVANTPSPGTIESIQTAVMKSSSPSTLTATEEEKTVPEKVVVATTNGKEIPTTTTTTPALVAKEELKRDPTKDWQKTFAPELLPKLPEIVVAPTKLSSTKDDSNSVMGATFDNLMEKLDLSTKTVTDKNPGSEESSAAPVTTTQKLPASTKLDTVKVKTPEAPEKSTDNVAVREVAKPETILDATTAETAKAKPVDIKKTIPETSKLESVTPKAPELSESKKLDSKSVDTTAAKTEKIADSSKPDTTKTTVEKAKTPDLPEQSIDDTSSLVMNKEKISESGKVDSANNKASEESVKPTEATAIPITKTKTENDAISQIGTTFDNLMEKLDLSTKSVTDKILGSEESNTIPVTKPQKFLSTKLETAKLMTSEDVPEVAKTEIIPDATKAETTKGKPVDVKKTEPMPDTSTLEIATPKAPQLSESKKLDSVNEKSPEKFVDITTAKIEKIPDSSKPDTTKATAEKTKTPDLTEKSIDDTGSSVTNQEKISESGKVESANNKASEASSKPTDATAAITITKTTTEKMPESSMDTTTFPSGVTKAPDVPEKLFSATDVPVAKTEKIPESKNINAANTKSTEASESSKLDSANAATSAIAEKIQESTEVATAKALGEVSDKSTSEKSVEVTAATKLDSVKAKIAEMFEKSADVTDVPIVKLEKIPEPKKSETAKAKMAEESEKSVDATNAVPLQKTEKIPVFKEVEMATAKSAVESNKVVDATNAVPLLKTEKPPESSNADDAKTKIAEVPKVNPKVDDTSVPISSGEKEFESVKGYSAKAPFSVILTPKVSETSAIGGETNSIKEKVTASDSTETNGLKAAPTVSFPIEVFKAKSDIDKGKDIVVPSQGLAVDSMTSLFNTISKATGLDASTTTVVAGVAGASALLAVGLVALGDTNEPKSTQTESKKSYAPASFDKKNVPQGTGYLDKLAQKSSPADKFRFSKPLVSREAVNVDSIVKASFEAEKNLQAKKLVNLESTFSNDSMNNSPVQPVPVSDMTNNNDNYVNGGRGTPATSLEPKSYLGNSGTSLPPKAKAPFKAPYNPKTSTIGRSIPDATSSYLDKVNSPPPAETSSWQSSGPSWQSNDGSANGSYLENMSSSGPPKVKAPFKAPYNPKSVNLGTAKSTAAPVGMNSYLDSVNTSPPFESRPSDSMKQSSGINQNSWQSSGANTGTWQPNGPNGGISESSQQNENNSQSSRPNIGSWQSSPESIEQETSPTNGSASLPQNQFEKFPLSNSSSEMDKSSRIPYKPVAKRPPIGTGSYLDAL